MAQIGSASSSSRRNKKKGKGGGPPGETQGRNEKSDRNQEFRKKRMAEKKKLEDLGRFAGSSEDEADIKPKKKKPVDGSNSNSNPIYGKRSAKRARKEVAQQKQKEQKQEQEEEEQEERQGANTKVEALPKESNTEIETKSKTVAKTTTTTKTKKDKKSKPSPSSGWKLKGGVVAKDVVLGEGKPAKIDCTVSITYVGTFPESGKVFDTNRNSNSPLKFKIGAGQVVEGLEVGLAGMKTGGERIITIPPKMGYGADGSPPEIPGGATLQFQVQLVSFKSKDFVRDF